MKPAEHQLQATVEAVSPDGVPVTLYVSVRAGSGSEMVEAALEAARALPVSRMERLREFEVLEIGGGRVVSIH